MCACETGVRVWALASEPSVAAVCRMGSLLPAVTPCIRGHCAGLCGFLSVPLRLVHRVHLSGVSGENEIRKGRREQGDERWTQRE